MREPYDPMRIYARAAKFYGWSLRDMEHMHFVTFFGFIREASEINEEEKAEYDRARRQQGQGSASPDQAMGMFAVAERYTGETIAI